MKSKKLKTVFWITFGIMLVGLGYNLAGVIGEVPYHSQVYWIVIGLFFVATILAAAYDNGWRAGVESMDSAIYKWSAIDMEHKAVIRRQHERIEKLSSGLREIADWQNYNSGGDPVPRWHPVDVANKALGITGDAEGERMEK